MRILDVRLSVAKPRAPATERFYRDELGLAPSADGFRVGHTTVEFARVSEAEPFYHFAFRVPRNRFAAAREWFAQHTTLLPDEGSGRTTFPFDNWNAEACYGLDPVGNIVELIAHHDLPEETPGGPFAGTELLGVCELGLVGPDTRAMAEALDPLGISLSDGSVDEPGRLAFLGDRAGVLILSPIGRGWMPTGRAAEPHPAEATLAGSRYAEVQLPGTQHRIRTVPAH